MYTKTNITKGVILLQKIAFNAITNQQIIDTRLQHAYQTGSLKGAVNIPLEKFKKVASKLISSKNSLVFIVDEAQTQQLDTLEAQALALSFPAPLSYLLLAEIPVDQLVQTQTISATDFLATTNDYILLDVRDQANVTKPAPEKNLKTISLDDLASTYAQLDPEKEIYTLCGSGNSATTAASFLNSHGHKATVIEGGATAIQKELENQ